MEVPMSKIPLHLRIPTLAVLVSMIVLSACSALPLSRSQAIQNSPNVPAIPNSAPAQQAEPTATLAPTTAAPPSGVIEAYQGTLESLYQKVGPSVVNIQVVEGSASGLPNNSFNGQGQNQGVQQALGSGFVWDMEGRIITNNHVVSGATKIEVTFSDGTTFPAKLVGADPDSDLAVIQVDGAKDLLHPVEIADSSQVKVGQLVIAIGNPFGLSGTMTTGIVSALERSLPANENARGASYTIPDIIQTDAAINPGNSGGVLINDQGQVIGVTSAIESASGSNSGIGFAIPSAIVQRVVPVLIKDGKYAHSWLGISAGDLVPALATAMNLPANQRGALIAEVTAGSPAEKAGLVASTKQVTIDGQQTTVGGDVITAIDGQPVKSINDVIAYLTASTSIGQKVTLNILRDGKQQSVDVVLAERPAQVPSSAQSPQIPTNPNNPSNGAGYLGVSSVTVSAEIAKAMGLPDTTKGVLVVQVQSGSPADTAGLKAGSKPTLIQGQMLLLGGDVITAIDGQTLASVQDLRAALAQHQSGDTIKLSVLRGSGTVDVSVMLASRTN
jgi:serine protease Do